MCQQDVYRMLVEMMRPEQFLRKRIVFDTLLILCQTTIIALTVTANRIIVVLLFHV